MEVDARAEKGDRVYTSVEREPRFTCLRIDARESRVVRVVCWCVCCLSFDELERVQTMADRKLLGPFDGDQRLGDLRPHNRPADAS